MEITTIYLSNLVDFNISVLVMNNRPSNETYQDIFGRHLEHLYCKYQEEIIQCIVPLEKQTLGQFLEVIVNSNRHENY